MAGGDSPRILNLSYQVLPLAPILTLRFELGSLTLQRTLLVWTAHIVIDRQIHREHPVIVGIHDGDVLGVGNGLLLWKT